MKYYIIAGEASGDLHGSNLIKALKIKDINADVRCWGGDLMQQAGGHLVKHYKEMAFMGFLEVIFNIRSIFKNIGFCKDAHYKTYDDFLFIHVNSNCLYAVWRGAPLGQIAWEQQRYNHWPRPIHLYPLLCQEVQIRQ